MTNENHMQEISARRSGVLLPRAEQWTMRSRIHNRTYRIFVSTPAGTPPEAGYPVLYLLDANSVFHTAVESMRLQGRRPDRTGVVPAVIVGIGYESEGPFDDSRFYDFTPAPNETTTTRKDGAPLPEQGGAEAFLGFIEDELKPLIEQEIPIDRSRQALSGHSLGGLFVLYTMLTRPEAFRTYIAGSPSIHWNRSLLLEQEKRFVSALQQHPREISLWLCWGELERQHPTANAVSAGQFAERLSLLSGCGVKVSFTEFENEGHVSVLPAMISRALRFAFQP
ncbi:alpha/beta hydrolase [Paenibacillus sp. GYB004]|uniref:alpha/beta hydrolase n=1 Tax=Paenibacillus sp. GYB004 TaxID=2994393 RepID=UPI002F963D1F